MQHAAGHVSGEAPSILHVFIGRPDLEHLRAAEAGVGRPQEVVVHPPRLLCAGQLHAHTGQAQLPDVVDRVQYADDAAFAVAFLVRDGSAVVEGVILRHGHDAQRAVTGGDVLRREVVEHRLRKAEIQQLLPDRRRLRLLGCVRGLPVHPIAAAEEIPERAANAQRRREHERDAPIRHAHRLRRDGVARLVERPGEPEQAAQDAHIAHEHGDRHEQTRVVHGGEYAHEHIPCQQRARAAALRRQPRLALHRAQPLPEAQQQRQHQRGAHRCRGAPAGIARQDGRVQDQRREHARRAQHGAHEAAAQPRVFPPQRAKTEQQQYRPDGGQEVVQAPEVQGDHAQRQTEQHALHRPPPRCHVGDDLLRRQLVHALRKQRLKGVVARRFPLVLTHRRHLPTSCAAVFSGGTADPRPRARSCRARRRSVRWTAGSNTSGKTAPGRSDRAVRAHRAARRGARPVSAPPPGMPPATARPPGSVCASPCRAALR